MLDLLAAHFLSSRFIQQSKDEGQNKQPMLTLNNNLYQFKQSLQNNVCDERHHFNSSLLFQEFSY